MTYYNTTNVEGEELRDYQIKADSQEKKILILFKKNKRATASQIWKEYGMNNAPLTSVRRAITNLTNKGLLLKTDSKFDGFYGRPECFYELK